jgi:Flp pilus assembly protein TadD
MSEGAEPARVRAELLLDQGRWAEAERSLREALVHEPNDGESLFHLAACPYKMVGRE